ncbi:hypothetical protein ACVWWJ_000571 [Luteibacter sp. HA06]
MTSDEFDEGEVARPSSLKPVHRLRTGDGHYDLQLLRDLEIVNARTRGELGPLPVDGVPLQVKRRPELPAMPSRAETTADEIREDEKMDVKYLAMAAAVMMTSSCHSGIKSWHMKSKVENGILKIPFYDHSFGATCFDTLRCRVVYDNAYIVNSGSPSEPFTERDRKNLSGGWGNLDFPSVARVMWTSKDGTDHDEKVDLGEIFSTGMVRYPPDLDVNDVKISVPPSAPDIVLVVEDRSIRVYMRAWISLLQPRFPGRKYSDFRHDPVVAYSQTF